MTHHGDDSEHEQHDGTRDENEPVGGTLGTTGTEGNGLPDELLGDSLDPDSAGIPGDQVTSDGGVSSDPLDGQNATGGYGDESTGLSDEASSDAPPIDGDGGGDHPADADLIDRDPGEDATTVNGGNADR